MGGKSEYNWEPDQAVVYQVYLDFLCVLLGYPLGLLPFLNNEFGQLLMGPLGVLRVRISVDLLVIQLYRVNARRVCTAHCSNLL